MKTKKYRYGKFYFKAYTKTVGHGYEVGLTYGKKTIFVGNFIHKEEATKWWTTLNKETTHFVNKYWINEGVSATWYCNFFSSHLYKTYYGFLDKLFSNYTYKYNQSFKRDVRRYRSMKRHWDHNDAPTFKAA